MTVAVRKLGPLPPEIQVGDTFLAYTMVEGIGDQHTLYLRTYQGVVSLENPEKTWNDITASAWGDVQKVSVEVVVKGLL